MEIFSTLRKECQLEYSHSVCPASSIFHFLSKILLATASAAETHTLMQMRNDAGLDLADGVADLRTRNKIGGFRRHGSSPPGVSQVTISQLGDVIQQ